MNRLALGTAQFGLPYGIANKQGQVTRSDAKNMLLLATKNGVDILDTAIAYGESETCLGEIGVNEFKVVTKLPPIPECCTDIPAWIKKQVMGSLRRLRVTQLYGLLLHRPEQLLEPNGKIIYRTLLALKTSGLVKKIGVSVYAPKELDALCSEFTFDIVQAPLNLVDRRLQQSGWMSRLKDQGVEIHTRSAFLQGLLLMPRKSIPEIFLQWNEVWDSWHSWLKESPQTALEICMAFPLSFPEVDRIVVGSDNLLQFEQIIRSVLNRDALSLPDLSCEDEKLINPALWSRL